MPARANGECEIIDKTLPAVRLSYSISQDEFARRRQVGLTLHNNTTCLILVRSNGEDAAKLRILYEIQDAYRTKAPTHKGHWVDGDLVFYAELAPGKSMPVAIEKTHASKRLTISVPFLFSWETDKASSADLEHRVYFEASYWPREPN